MNELHAHAGSGLTLYAVLLDANGKAWNGAAFETISGAAWASYDIALTEAAAGIYLATMPAVATGVYSYVVYERAGGSPAVTDAIRGGGWLAWDGSAEIVPASAAALATVGANVSAIKAKTDALDMSDVTVVAAISGTTITILRGDTLTVAITSLGSLTAYVNIWFTVKRNREVADSAAIIQVDTATGLLVVNGTPATPYHGSISVDSAAAGNLTITLAASVTASLGAETGLYYDVQWKSPSGAIRTLTSGAASVTADVTRSTV